MGVPSEKMFPQNGCSLENNVPWNWVFLRKKWSLTWEVSPGKIVLQIWGFLGENNSSTWGFTLNEWSLGNVVPLGTGFPQSRGSMDKGVPSGKWFKRKRCSLEKEFPSQRGLPRRNREPGSHGNSNPSGTGFPRESGSLWDQVPSGTGFPREPDSLGAEVTGLNVLAKSRRN